MTVRKTKWRRIRPAVLDHRHAGSAAAQEARLIVASGGLAWRHAADLSHSVAEPQRSALFASQSPVNPWREALSYVASIVVAAILLATFLILVAPRTFPSWTMPVGN